MKKFTLCLKISLISALSLFLFSFSDPESIEQYVGFLQKSFTEHYDFSQESNQIKRYELNVTNNGFCRYKRYFTNGKTEYFAFKLSKFKDMDYYGDTSSGKLYLRTKGDDVIVQTYKDRGGDVDSMATQVIIPLKNMEAEDLNLIRENFNKINPQTP
ncbi:hypothetical protein EZ449_07035 [Pedobacter frigidisoli]|uniref:Uncharacterized protein n=1 Tax=Pedobacter frigidisoli TaxID=2530455 RepID=A0A4R0P5V9_9SPHI|nr:hypothetical protein [Pedobacter frigidisoli]TCD11236.1 hypothetical protein EZ449_07035 [Pedobacter frigidisoli]